MRFSFYLALLSPLLAVNTLLAQTRRIVVAQDGTGNFKTVQAALDAIPQNNKTPVLVCVRRGIYREVLTLAKGKDKVSLVGEDKDATVLTYNNHTGKMLPNGKVADTYTSPSFFIYADDFTAKDLTFQNDAGFNAGQAVAVFANGDRLQFYNCNFKGFQDVLFCSGYPSRQYYKNCYIEGITDFIFGPATAVFEDCRIHSKKNSHVTAASTPAESLYGFVFIGCRLTADDGLTKVSLGRPWRPYASVTYIRCKLGKHILPQGWDNWKKPENEKTNRFAEYKNKGEGAKPDSRFKWIRMLSTKEAKEFTPKKIFGDWKPDKL